MVVKNHRREQSANATAGRHNRNSDWGNAEDERRSESIHNELKIFLVAPTPLNC